VAPGGSPAGSAARPGAVLTWRRGRPIIAPLVSAAALPQWYVLTLAGLFGACLGSFLNVVIARVPHGRSIVSPGSACPRCGSAIRWYDNVPVLSWLWLRARCRGCALPISARYPVVELLVTGVALLVAWRHGATLEGLLELAFAVLLVALAAIDLDTWLLPNSLTWSVIGLGLAGAALGGTPAGTLGSATLGAALGFAAFGAIFAVGEWVLHKETMGLGDVWLLAGLAGWFGPKGFLPLVLLSSIQGAAFGLAQLALGRGQPGRQEAPSPPAGDRGRAGGPEAEVDDWVPPRHAVPFGPFLVAAALEWLWAGDWLAARVGLLEIFR
jgi:leader peptidase (prepilin peptidase)/N-methyltransferase